MTSICKLCVSCFLNILWVLGNSKVMDLTYKKLNNVKIFYNKNLFWLQYHNIGSGGGGGGWGDGLYLPDLGNICCCRSTNNMNILCILLINEVTQQLHMRDDPEIQTSYIICLQNTILCDWTIWNTVGCLIEFYPLVNRKVFNFQKS